MTAYLPWPYSETAKYKELIDRAETEGRPGKTHRPPKNAAYTFHGKIMKAEMKYCKQKIKYGTKVDVIIETSECQHLVQPLLEFAYKNYDVRFLSYAKLPPTTIFTLGFPAVCLFMARCKPEISGLAERRE